MGKRKNAMRERGAASTRAEMETTRSLVLNGELVLYGVIDPFAMFDDESIRCVDVMASLAELGDQEKIVVRINSPGGAVMEGLAIYNALRAWGKPIEVHIDAMAASIASIIAMAGDDIVMAGNGTIMIHNPYGAMMGDADDMRAMAAEIDRQKAIMINIYAQRTGLDSAEINALMTAETFMSADDAVEKGFADRVDQPLAIAACQMLAPDIMRKLLAPGLKASADKNTRTSRPGPAAPAAQPPKDTEMGAQSTSGAVPPASTTHAANHDTIRAEATAAERARVHGISSAVRAAKLDHTFADEMINAGLSVDQAREKIINKWAETQTQASGGDAPAHGQNRVVLDGVDKWLKGAQLGLMARAGLKGGERNEFTGLTLSELARSSLTTRNVASGSLSRMDMIGRAFTTLAAGPGYHSSSDFGNVLQNVAHLALMKGFAEADETFQLWTGKGILTDFRPQNRSDLGLFPALDVIPEGAEYKYGTFGDEGTSIVLATYGKMFAITRQAVINDNLDELTRVPDRMGRAAKRTIGNLAYAVLNGNPTMQDGLALFHANHGNLIASGSGAPPSVASLTAARVAMVRQSDPSGLATGLGIRPKFILTPPELEDQTAVLLKSQYDPTAGSAFQRPNPVSNFATPIADNRLAGTAWYLAADPATTDTIEVAYLDGNEEPFLDQRQGWSVDGTEFKVRIDAGVKALHWRGLAKNAGA